jgi:D-arabinose 1-dehydrogenase-like Zn-dependent alcohol dehydrogenase
VREDRQQVCPNQSQPGITRWGSFAESVVVDHAATNLVALPAEVDFATAAGLGCRFATAYRAIVDQSHRRRGEWLAIFGCGGIGLSAVMIAVSRGIRVIAVDVSDSARKLAESLGAIDAAGRDVSAQIRAHTGDGAHGTLDALGRADTLSDALASLRPGGRHVQVGLLLGAQANPAVDMTWVLSRELEIVGSHGMAAHSYPRMLTEIAAGTLVPGALVARTIGLAEAGVALAAMSRPGGPGTTVVLIGD